MPTCITRVHESGRDVVRVCFVAENLAARRVVGLHPYNSGQAPVKREEYHDMPTGRVLFEGFWCGDGKLFEMSGIACLVVLR